jgi:hypothetical protein
VNESKQNLGNHAVISPESPHNCVPAQGNVKQSQTKKLKRINDEGKDVKTM